LDNEARVIDYSYYESRFTNIKRYNYESFGEDFINPESEHHATLHLLKEVSDKLRTRRSEKGGLLNWSDDDRRISI